MSSEGFLVRFVLGLVAGLATAAFIVSSAVSEPTGAVLAAGQTQGSWATRAEVSWLQRFGQSDRCSTTSAPTVRLRAALDKFRSACASGDRALMVEADQMLPPGEVRNLPVVAGDVRMSRIEPRFARLATDLAAKPVEVRCWSRPDWRRLIREERAYTGGQLGHNTLGFAGINGNRVNLAPDVCDALAQLAYRRLQPVDEAGRLMLAAAVVTLSHEAQHSKGIANEAVAECNAIQVSHRTAIALGADPVYAATLVHTYWQQYDHELPEYRSADCRRGGALDRGDATSIWR